MKKTFFTVLLIFIVLCNSILIYADEEDTVLNVALSVNNPNVRVTSASHPFGGYYHNGTDGIVVSLDKVNDGVTSSSNIANVLHLTLRADTSDTQYHELYAPVNDGRPIQICIDLGKTYDISSLKLWARGNADTSLQGVHIYGSNDWKSTQTDWRESADLCLIKDFGNVTSSNGNIISAADCCEITSDAFASLNSNKFRYIIVSKEAPLTGYNALELGEIEVFANPSTADDNFINNLENDGINADFLKYSGYGNNAFIVGKFNKQTNSLIDIKTFNVNNSSVNNEIINFENIMNEIAEDDEFEYKFFLWDSPAGGIPAVKSQSALMTIENEVSYKEYWVSPYGDDSNDGSEGLPFATVKRAQEEVRKESEYMTGDIYVYIENGTYYTDDIIRFKPEDSGKNGFDIVYKGIDKPVISAGYELGNFKHSADYTALWEIDVPDNIENISSIYVGDRKGTIAHSEVLYEPLDIYMEDDTKIGLYVSKDSLGSTLYENIENAELYFYEGFTHTRFVIENVIADPENSEQYIVTVPQPFVKYFNDSASHHPKVNYEETDGTIHTDHFAVANVMELLDTPGEYYFDKINRKIYYMPRDGESLSDKVVIPDSEMLVMIEGLGTENKVHNLRFEGIHFAHTKNSVYDSDFYASRQQQGMGDNAQGVKHNAVMMTSAVEINHAQDIKFDSCVFSGLGMMGINMVHGVENVDVVNSAFFDIGDSAIGVGHMTHSDDTIEQYSVNPSSNSQMDITTNSVLYTSDDLKTGSMRNDYVTTGKYAYGAPLFITEDEFNSYSVSSTDRIWKGENSDEIQYIKYDFLDYYTVDKILLYFGSANNSDYRDDFEILLSNDADFTAGSYYTVHTQGATSADNQSTFDVGDKTTKYRYAMIRSTNPDDTHLYMARVSILTNDVEPYTNITRCSNINIKNNYIARAGIGNGLGFGGTAVSSYGYEDGITITNNEICYLPYSAIGIGHGWDSTLMGSRNHYIANNYIHNINQVLNDGGAVYTLSNQENTRVENNYIENTGVGRALYPDQGSSNITYRNNVTIDTPYLFYSWSSSTNNLDISVSFSTTDNIKKQGSGHFIGAVNIETQENLSENAQRIKDNAGINTTYNTVKKYDTTKYVPFFDSNEIIKRYYISGN